MDVFGAGPETVNLDRLIDSWVMYLHGYTAPSEMRILIMDDENLEAVGICFRGKPYYSRSVIKR
jgi:hypothetical protein